MKRRLISFVLALVMVLGMFPVPVFATTIPDGAPFSAITTDAGDVADGDVVGLGFVTVEDWQDYVQPHYHVVVPAGTKTATITLSKQCMYANVVVMQDGKPAIDWNQNGKVTFSGNTPTISVSEYISSVGSAGWTSGSAVMLVDDAYQSIALFTFEYASSQDSGQENIPVTGISLNPISLNLEVGKTATLTPEIAPENATDKTVTWSSSNPDVASVANGVVTAKAGGSATITALAGTETATCQVTVEEPITNLRIYPFDVEEYMVEVGDDGVDIVACCTPKTTTQNTVV